MEKEIDPWIKGIEDAKVVPKGKISSASIVTHQFEAYGNDDKAFQQKKKKGQQSKTRKS